MKEFLTKVSFSHVLVVWSAGSVAWSQSLASAIAFTASVVLLGFELFESRRAVESEIEKRLKEVEADKEFFVSQLQTCFRNYELLQMELNALTETQKTVQKQAEETKRVLSQMNVASAFVPRNRRAQNEA